MRIKCPICAEMTTWEENPERPFCSARCRLLDLGRWASDEYSIKGDEPAPQEAGEVEAS